MRYLNFLPAVCALFLLPSCSGKNEVRKNDVYHNVFVVNPQGGGLETVTTLPATVEEGRTISVGFKTAGQIERIYVKEGARVQKGQLLAVLDSKDYELGVATLRERLSNLKSESARQTKLHASGNMSDNDYEKAMSGLRQLELQLELEENRLSYCRLLAPSAGIVTKVNFENSEMVDAGTPVLELMDNSSLEAVVDLPVRLYAQRAHFEEYFGVLSTAGAKPVRLGFLSLTPKADNTQLYRLRLSVPADSGFTPGMNIKVQIVSEGAGAHENMTLPLTSVFEENGNNYVWIVNPSDSVISARQVVIDGVDGNGRVNVKSGIDPNDIVVRVGVHHLAEGEKVNILTDNSETNPGNII